MKINNYSISLGKKTYKKVLNTQKEAENTSKKTSASSGKDVFSMSEEAKLLVNSLNETNKTEDGEKNAALKEKIENGEYKVDVELLASKMLGVEE